MDAYYTDLGGGRFAATEHTSGPWSPDAQHGGPPCALALDQILHAAGPSPLRVGRISCELIQPVPVDEITVEVLERRPGRDLRLLDAQLSAAGRPVMLARAWLLKPAPALAGRHSVAAPQGPAAPPPKPAGLKETDPTGPQWNTSGYLRSIEWRTTHGGFHELGPGGVWGRPRRPLVGDRQASGPVLALLLADTGSGIGLGHDLHDVQAINVDLTVFFDRDPIGDWIHLDAATTGVEGGGSFSRTTLSDEQGPFAQGVQTLLVRRP